MNNLSHRKCLEEEQQLKKLLVDRLVAHQQKSTVWVQFRSDNGLGSGQHVRLLYGDLSLNPTKVYSFCVKRPHLDHF